VGEEYVGRMETARNREVKEGKARLRENPKQKGIKTKCT
jgi:hypothetical protein